MYKVVLSEQAVKDIDYLKADGLDEKTKAVLKQLKHTPKPDCAIALVGRLSGLYSVRINYNHRIIYQLKPRQKLINVISMYTGPVFPVQMRLI